jgi:hypothetical protein
MDLEGANIFLGSDAFSGRGYVEGWDKQIGTFSF